MSSIAFRSAWSRASEAGRLFATLLLAWGSLDSLAQSGESYKLQPTDIVVVDVVNEPQLGAKEYRVTATGEISYPFIGAIKVVDRTTTDVQTELKRLLEADYLVNAQVIVQVKEFRKQLISIIGQVARPGLIEIPAERKMTVLEAIGAAGGTTRLAKTSDIELIRAGRSEPMRLSLEELKNPEKTIYVEAGDVIHVKESRI